MFFRRPNGKLLLGRRPDELQPSVVQRPDPVDVPYRMLRDARSHRALTIQERSELFDHRTHTLPHNARHRRRHLRYFHFDRLSRRRFGPQRKKKQNLSHL